MATKGFNPFLSEADFAPPPPAQQEPQLSNPFLSDFGPPPPQPQAAPTQNDNPFYNPFGAPPPAEAPPAPFAFDSTPPQPPASNQGGGNPFASFVDPTPPPPAATATSNGPFSAFDTQDSTDMWATSTSDTSYPLQPEPILMMDTGPDEQILLPQEHEDIMEPTRPPPASVPRSTKELLDSVTGALEANSDSLMDRLRLTQPSPINLVPSPSPSPRSPSPDLLGDDGPPPPPPSANPLQPSPHQLDSIIDLFDAPIQPPKATGPKTTFDILGLYNTAPQQPPPQQPPQAPVPAPHIQTEELVSMVDVAEVMDINIPTFQPTQAPPSQPLNLIDQIDNDNPPLDFMSAEPHVPTTGKSSATTPPSDIYATQPPQVADVPPARPEMPELPAFGREETVQLAHVPVESVPTKAAAAGPPPERPKLPPQPQPQAVAASRSPVHETKPFPSRPPPPVPPAPRITPSASPSHQPPAVPPQPHPPQHHAAPPPVPPQPHVQHPPPTPPQPHVQQHPHPPVPPQPHVQQHPHPPVPPQPHVQHHPPAPPAPRAPAPVEVVAPEKSPFPAPAQPPSAVNIFSQGEFSQEEAAVDRTGIGSGASIFGVSTVNVVVNPPAPPSPLSPPEKPKGGVSAFDDFDAKFNSMTDEVSGGSANAFGDPFGGAGTGTAAASDSAWGAGSSGGDVGNAFGSGSGFGDEGSMGFGSDGFDSFLQMTEPPPVPQSTPAKTKTNGAEDEEAESQDLSIFIRPRTDNDLGFGLAPALAPPPKSPAISTNSGYSEDSANTAFVPFLSSAKDSSHDFASGVAATQMNRTDSTETPDTPLFEEDTSQPLEDFPRIKYEGDGWDMHMRHPNKKKITGQRFWKKVYVQLGYQNDVPIVQIYSNKGDKDPFQEIPLQACYSCSEIGAQQFDQYGKIFTMKIQYVFYKERPGVRPGQISKAGRISDKLSQFAAFAIQGDYQGVKEFGSDLKKLGLPLEHAPQVSQLVKLGTQTYEELKQFSAAVEEALFRLNVHRDRAIQYKTEEIQVTIVDEYYVEQDIYGVVTRQIARVRLFFLSFLSGIAEVEMGMNDLRRQGKEVVGRHDIIPIATEEWIRTEDIEFSNCVQLDEFEATKTIKFKPPDASYFEILRFRVRPPRHRELPLQVKTVFTSTGNRIEIRSDILVPGFTSRKLGQIPCEDVMLRFPIPECWIYMFRVEKHFRYGSVKSAHRRSGKVKGIERFLGAVEAVEQSLMEVTSGQAKYEHQHRAIVWRIPRLPKEGQGAYTTHSFFCHITLQAHEQVPENLSKYCYLEFTMPHTTVSHTVVRSISVPTCEEPPEKCVRYLSRHEYQIEIEHTQGFAPASYSLAASTAEKEKEKEEKKDVPAAVVDRTEGWFPEEKPKADDDSDFSDD